MKKAILISILGFALLSIGFAATAFAYDYYDPCVYYGCWEPIVDPINGTIITSINDNVNNNDNYNFSNNVNTNTNNISIDTYGGGGGYGGGTNYDAPQCDDGIDNDNDGRVDMNDSGCSSYSDNSERTGTTSDYECNDNRDNDGDGDYDYPEDAGCSSRTDDSEDSDNNNTRYQCNDNRDNDNDGDYDYPEDAGCSSRTDNSENSDTNNRYECDDNRDNDNDGDVDYPEDAGCRSRTDDSEDSDDNDRNQCNDNRDNDGDGDYDYPEDAGCSSRTDNSESSEGSSSRKQCNDNRDNDGDGDYDYPEDAGCSSRTDNSENSDRNSNNGGAPYFTSNPSNVAIAGQLYTYNADAISPNGRDITYSLAVKPTGMTINSSTGLVQWAVPALSGNSYQGALVVATDTAGNQTTQSYILSVRANVVPPVYPPVYPPVRPPVNPPVQEELRISNLRIDGVDGDVIVSFNTNISARGSVRYGQVSEANNVNDFTYPFSQISEGGQAAFHKVNLGPLTPNQAYYIRAFASAGADSAFSPEFAFTPRASEIAADTEVAGTDSCFDGIDNDRDGVADAADPDCEAPVDGQVAGTTTFASALESFGAFLISPWFLLLVIIVLIIYIIVTRREHEDVVVHGPIEIKS